MDKYEFSLKMEQMKKLIHEEDYLTALKIVEGIDWNRVRNTNLLTMAATVFEKNDRLEEAKGILNLALDRAPVGKRLLYKLTELAVRTGDLEQAEDYYYEFRQADPEDIGNYVLQYMILKARHAPYDRQLQPLELFCQADPDEVWLYELATTYEFAGRIEDCIRTCDRIALLYGDSQYGLKALRLKMRYTDLTDAQKNIMYPRSVPQQQTDNEAADGYGYGYSESVGQSETQADYVNDYQGGYRGGSDISRSANRDEAYGTNYSESEAAGGYAGISEEEEAARRNSDALAAARYENEDEEFNAYVMRLEAKAAEQRAAEEARRAEEQKTAEAARRADAERIAAERSAALKQKAAEQQAAMQRAAEASAKRETISGADVAAHSEAAGGSSSAAVQDTEAGAGSNAAGSTDSAESTESADDEGQQMAFDFGTGEVKVVEEPEINEAESISEDQNDCNSLTAGTVVPKAEIPVSGAASAASAASVSAAQSVLAAAGMVPAVSVSAGSSAADGFGTKQNAERTEAGSAIAAVEAALNGAPTEKPVYAASEINNPNAAAYVRTSEEQRPARPVTMKKFNMIIEAETVADGLSIAVDELKAVHEENGIQHASAKTTAAKLNEIGFTESIAEKIMGKDFVIENAGDLDKDIIEDIYNFIRTDRSGTIVVMIDTPEGLDNIEDARPELFDICDYISDIDDEEFEENESKKAKAAYSAETAADRYDDYSDEPEEDDADDDYGDDEPYDDDFDDEDTDEDEDAEADDRYEDDEDDADDLDDDDEYEPREPQKRSSGKVKERFNNIRAIEPKSDGEQMESDDFAKYCVQYASEIDCSITGKSMLALYERIELMEEDGIPLTKENAENLIEEAADRAEKPPLGKRISGVFHSKYDKNGCLILKEDDFIH